MRTNMDAPESMDTIDNEAAVEAIKQAMAEPLEEEPDFLDSPFLDLEARLTMRQFFQVFVVAVTTLAVTTVAAAVLGRFIVWMWVGR